MIETRTGDVLRLSGSGIVIDTVKTDPRLVPNQSVGMSADGSERFIQIKKKENTRQLKAFPREKSRRQIGCQLTALLCITINER
jgi:hypothetical protein